MRTLPSMVASATMLVLLVMVVWVAHPVPAPTTSTVTVGGFSDPEIVQAAKTALPTIDIKGRAPKTGYTRTHFGAPWADTDSNGCDTRNDVLRRDLTGVVLRVGSSCVVETGTLDDPYTGGRLGFVRGVSKNVDVDHVVPLAWAWQHGAGRWDALRRREFANQPPNLVAVSATANRAKGDSGPGAWLPPDRAAWCGYVARFTLVVANNELWLNPADQAAIRRVLSDC